MRRGLDLLYAAAFGVAALCFGAIALLVLVQIAGRLIDRGLAMVNAGPLGITVPSLAEIGAFLFVSGVFLGMAGTLRRGGHVRVTLATQKLGAGASRAVAGLVILLGLGLGVWAAWNSGLQAWDSWAFDSVSYGMVKVPLALPQAVMTFGLAVFCVALADEGVAVLRGEDPAFRRAEAETEASGDAGGH